MPTPINLRSPKLHGHPVSTPKAKQNTPPRITNSAPGSGASSPSYRPNILHSPVSLEHKPALSLEDYDPSKLPTKEEFDASEGKQKEERNRRLSESLQGQTFLTITPSKSSAESKKNSPKTPLGAVDPKDLGFALEAHLRASKTSPRNLTLGVDNAMKSSGDAIKSQSAEQTSPFKQLSPRRSPQSPKPRLSKIPQKRKSTTNTPRLSTKKSKPSTPPFTLQVNIQSPID